MPASRRARSGHRVPCNRTRIAALRGRPPLRRAVGERPRARRLSTTSRPISRRCWRRCGRSGSRLARIRRCIPDAARARNARRQSRSAGSGNCIRDWQLNFELGRLRPCRVRTRSRVLQCRRCGLCPKPRELSSLSGGARPRRGRGPRSAGQCDAGWRSSQAASIVRERRRCSTSIKAKALIRTEKKSCFPGSYARYSAYACGCRSRLRRSWQ
jgi:hypothetical protein